MLTADEIQKNWEIFTDYIVVFVKGERGKKLLSFYESYKERLYLMPASSKLGHHSAFDGGYISHVNKVVKGALKLNRVWDEMEVNTSLYTEEELVFSALNHDLGKMGDKDTPNYLPQDNDWRRDNMGEMYKMNPLLQFMPVQDRTLYLLQQAGIECSFNEWTAIKTHDGLYDESNKSYLMGFTPDMKPRSAISYIIHQADLMAARIEFEQQYVVGTPKKEKPSFPKRKQ